MTVTKTWVLVPLANDAQMNNEKKRYINIGPNSRLRIAEAVRWAQEKIPTAPHIWIFGAGTHIDWRRGATLGVWAEAYLRTLLQNPITVLSNHIDKNYYGTHEEIKWGVKAVRKQHAPGTVVFVFFGPWWHLLRARLIWWFFFKKPWGAARFVNTNDGAKPSWVHEFFGYLKILGHRFFPRWVKTKDQNPYPPVERGFGIEM